MAITKTPGASATGEAAALPARASAQVLALPGAAVSPVQQVRRRGRLPKSVVSLSRARAATWAPAVPAGQVHAPAADLRPEYPFFVQEAMDWLLSTANQGPVFHDLRAVRDYLRLWLGPQGFESFGALFLDAQHRLICCRELFRGTLTATDVYPREVAKAALELNAGAVVLFHNHPSGNPEPSEADVRLTACLRDMLQRLDVRVLDHLVIGSRGSVSLAERRLV